jgi:S1-C subfamily serine protease
MPDDTVLQAISTEFANLVESAGKRVVGIQGSRRRGSSGIIWGPGAVVTAEEPIRDDDELHLTLPDGNTVAASLAGRDPGTDIAVLRAEIPNAPAAPTAATELRLGGLALAVGRRKEPVVRVGILAEMGEAWHSIRGGRVDRLLRLDLTLDLVAEGGAVIDAAGALIGMGVLGPRGRVLAIPAETIARVAPRILSEGTLGRGYLGLGLHPVPGGAAGEPGVIVISLDPEGPGAKAGVLVGDVIVAWNGEPIRRLRDIFRRLGSDVVGTEITLGVLRAGARTEVTLHAGKRPQR